ncbi:MAG: hypothetical protein ACRBDI_05880 [Alphaproteobacteria bacterium]
MTHKKNRLQQFLAFMTMNSIETPLHPTFAKCIRHILGDDTVYAKIKDRRLEDLNNYLINNKEKPLNIDDFLFEEEQDKLDFALLTHPPSSVVFNPQNNMSVIRFLKAEKIITTTEDLERHSIKPEKFIDLLQQQEGLISFFDSDHWALKPEELEKYIQHANTDQKIIIEHQLKDALKIREENNKKHTIENLNDEVETAINSDSYINIMKLGQEQIKEVNDAFSSITNKRFQRIKEGDSMYAFINKLAEATNFETSRPASIFSKLVTLGRNVKLTNQEFVKLVQKKLEDNVDSIDSISQLLNTFNCAAEKETTRNNEELEFLQQQRCNLSNSEKKLKGYAGHLELAELDNKTSRSEEAQTAIRSRRRILENQANLAYRLQTTISESLESAMQANIDRHEATTVTQSKLANVISTITYIHEIETAQKSLQKANDIGNGHLSLTDELNRVLSEAQASVSNVYDLNIKSRNLPIYEYEKISNDQEPDIAGG